jgi:cation diffusion facilitator family transporter
MWLNILLTLFKFIAGIVGMSQALIADALHSTSDFATDIVVLFGFHFVKKPVDDCHDYGHGKFETLSSFIVGISLIVTGFYIAWGGISGIIGHYRGNISPAPALLAILAALVSIIAKEYMYRKTNRVGKEIQSPALIANAQHHRSDALSSIGVLFGVLGARFLGESFRVLDPLAAVIVSYIVIKVAFSICFNAIRELLEESLPKSIEDEIMEILSGVDGVHYPHSLRTRRIGANYAIDVHIEIKKDMSVEKAHSISDIAESKLFEKYGKDTIVNIHIEPLTD